MLSTELMTFKSALRTSPTACVEQTDHDICTLQKTRATPMLHTFFHNLDSTWSWLNFTFAPCNISCQIQQAEGVPREHNQTTQRYKRQDEMATSGAWVHHEFSSQIPATARYRRDPQSFAVTIVFLAIFKTDTKNWSFMQLWLKEWLFSQLGKNTLMPQNQVSANELTALKSSQPLIN